MDERFFSNPETNKITLYNQLSDGTFKRTIIENVYVRKVRKSVINEKGEEVASSATIVIPVAFATIKDKPAFNSFIDCKSVNKQSSILNFTLNVPLVDNAWTLLDGDYIVDKATEMEFDLREIKKNNRVYRIQSVSDNRKGGLKHFKIEVVE